MANDSYQRQLADPKWQRKRLEVLNRDDFTCKQCGAKDKELHIHHNYYSTGKQAWEYPDDCYLTLCYECHQNYEKDKVQLRLIDAEINIRKISCSDIGTVLTHYVAFSGRQYRVAKVIQLAEEIYPYLCNYMVSVQDWKGCITVVWRVNPTKEQKEAIEKAWEENAEYDVTHEIRGQQ